MQRTKIYISVSKLSDRKDVEMLIEKLKSCETYQYVYEKGMKYDEEVVLAPAKMIIVIPPMGLLNEPVIPDKLLVGKGNYSESRYGLGNNLPVYVYQSEYQKLIPVFGIELIDEKSYQVTGNLLLDVVREIDVTDVI